MALRHKLDGAENGGELKFRQLDYIREDAAERTEEDIPLPPTPPGQIETGRPIRATRSGQGISLLPIFGAMVAVYLFVAAMTAQTRILALSERSAELQAEIGALETEQARLRIARESALNLAEVEEYATTTLGMVPPGPEQIEYITVEAPDRAKAARPEERPGLVDRISDALMAAAAYLAWEGE
ncbi:MAG: cell division protein FtsL [Oscillospiraceae bacterium]|nr:cell division protein FtsL [Oscillospiraceae bacterium]